MRGFSILSIGACITLAVIMMGIRTVEGIRSMVMRPQARDLSLGSNDLQGLQSMWNKESQEDEPSLSLALDPRKTWEAFILNSERQKKARRRKNRKRNRKIPTPKEGPAGPPGPRGPPGPPGHDGGILSTQEMEEYIRDYIKEYLEEHNDTRRLNEVDENQSGEILRRSKVRVAFSATLPRSPTIKPSALTVIDSFTITFSPGLFVRRVVLEHGGFAVTKNGLYQVAASLVLHPKGMSNTALIPKNDISVYICVNNCNKDNRRLEWAGSVGEGAVTAVLTGHIMLNRGNTLLVAIDNTSERHIQVGTGSSFSAAMIGT